MAGELSPRQLAELSSAVASAVTRALSSSQSQQSQSQAAQRSSSYGPTHEAVEEQESEHQPLGRPRLDIDLDDVEFLCSLKLSLTKVAAVMGVSRCTLYRRMIDEGRVIGGYSSISDADLDSIIHRVKLDHPHDGEVMMAGHISRIGIHITRARLRASIHRVDPEGVAARSRRVIRRRVYSVPYPNYVWHIDSHHKLIRWRMVTHGAVDGYSRKILYLKCANNNKATTVVPYFSHAVSLFGLPDKVRSDKGGENTQVWQFMLHHRREVITGSSTHNERIERLWRDVFRCVCQIFYNLLYHLEDEGVLDPLNDTDLFCVHFSILPEVNRCLDEFVKSWNQHCLSSEHNATPEALYTVGLLEHAVSDSHDENHATTTNSDCSSVDVNVGLEDVTVVSIPPTPQSVCSILQHQLSSLLNTAVCADFGLNLYREAIQIVGTHIQRGCEECFT